MDTFKIEVKIVDSLPEGDCGYCVTRSKKLDKYEIAISRKAHKTVADFGSTMLHELLHLWVYFLNVYGYRVKLAAEHKWIRAVETVIIHLMYLLTEKKKRKK